MRLRWERETERQTRRSRATKVLASHLFAGALQFPVATLHASSSGATFSLSGGYLGFGVVMRREYLPLEEAEADVGAQVAAWFAAALAEPPAEAGADRTAGSA